jgi:hypothetical protein
MLSFSISYSDLMKFHYFADTTLKEGIGAEREGDFFTTEIFPHDTHQVSQRKKLVLYIG